MKKHRRFRTRYDAQGSIIARRIGVNHLHQSEIYHALITMPWWRFFAWLALCYLVIAFLFSVAYTFADVENMRGLSTGKSLRQFAEVLMYSAQTLSTLGGVGITPVGLVNNLIFTLESVVALLGAAVITGLLYVRLSRPSAQIVFSPKAIIAPYRGGKALMVRIGNAKKNELLEISAQVIFVTYKDSTTRKEFLELTLERVKIPYLPLTWTIVHPIDEKSPFNNFKTSGIQAREFDVMVTLIALDGVTGQNVFSAHGYTDRDMIWSARFLTCTEVEDDGVTIVHLDKIGEYERLADEDAVLGEKGA